MSDTPDPPALSEAIHIATFAGGCFWCMEPAYQEHEGVVYAVVGYAGGSKEDAQYSKVSSGQTEHREVVQLRYDSTIVSYEELLDIFWRQIDPTDAGGQFADRGFHYTTAIYYHTEEQQRTAKASKERLTESGKFDKPVVTEILPYNSFFLAEEYHQDYYQKSSERYKQYKKGSGREDFLKENWSKDAIKEQNTFSISDEERREKRKLLDEQSYEIIVRDGTEPAFDNAYWNLKDHGIYVDKVSGEPLYASVHKYDSKTGWPSFWRAIDEEFITTNTDWKLLYPRTEVRSTYGDSHLGHLFKDGPKEKTGLRHCINSAALHFVPKEEMQKEGYGQYLYLFEDL